MSSRENQGDTKEDKHLKYDIVDGQRKTVEKNFTVQKPDTTGNSQKQRTSNDGSVKQKSDNEKTKTKAVENKETKPIIIKKHVKNLKQSKRNFTNIFRPVTMRDAETMTDLLKIFETPSNSVVSVFKSSSASLQEIEVMTDLTGDEVAAEVGLKDVETTTEDLALTVLEMTNDLDYMNLKLLEDERERKMEFSDGVLERDDNMLPEKSSDGVYGDLLERMYICLGIAPVEIRKLGEAENETPADDKKVVKDVTEVVKKEEVMVESKSELLESLKSEEFETPSADDAESTDNLSQIRSSSMRSTIRESLDNSEIVEGVMEVNYEEDVKEEESVEVVVEEPEEHPPFEEGVPEDEDIVQEDNVEEPIIDVDEINEGDVYIDLNETYHFRELFDVDESEVYVEENINFESEDDVYREQEAKGSYEQRYTFNIKGGEDIEKEESPTDVPVRRATLSEDAITVIDRESDTDLYRSSLLAAVVVDEKYQSIIEKQFSDEEVQQFHEDDQELADTVEIDKLAGELVDDYLDTFTEIDLNYPRYDDEWEIPRVIEALCEDQSVGKILRDFGLLEELEDNKKSSHPTISTSETDSIIIGRHDSSMLSFLDKATKYADQITDLSGLEAATWKVSNQFRVSMIYNEEPGSQINEKDIHALLKKEESASANIEKWLHRQSLRQEVQDVDQLPYIFRTEQEYEGDLRSRSENSSDDFEISSSEQIDRKDLVDDTSSELTAGTHSLGSYTEIDIHCEGYPRILDQIKSTTTDSNSHNLKSERELDKDDTVSMILDDDDDDYVDVDDENEDDSSILETNQDSIDVFYELIKYDPYGSYISQKMLNVLEYFKKIEFHNEIPYKLKALEALLVEKAARKKFTETLQLKSARHANQSFDSYSCKPELFNDSVSVLVWNIFNCFFLPISSKLSHRAGSSQTSNKIKKQINSRLQTVTDGTLRNEDNKQNEGKTVLEKSRKPLSTRVNVVKAPVIDEELNSIAIQTENVLDDIENQNVVDERNDDFVIVRRFKMMETQTDVSFVAKIKEEEALIEKTFAIHNHSAAQTVEFSPEFLNESFTSLDGTVEEKEEDEIYWKNVENIFTDDSLVHEQLVKISSEKGRSPIEILITVSKDGKKLFAPLRSDKGLEEAMDPRLEQFLSVLNETPVSNLFDDLLHQPMKLEISRMEKGERISGDNLQAGKEESLSNQVVSENMSTEKRPGSVDAGSVSQTDAEKQKSGDNLVQSSTERLGVIGGELDKNISDCEEKERQELEDVIKTGIEFLEESDVEQDSVGNMSLSGELLSEEDLMKAVCHSSVESLKRFYTVKYLESFDDSSSFSSVITVSELNENEVIIGRQGEKTILKVGGQDQRRSVTVFKEISLKDSPHVYDTDKDFQQKTEVKPLRQYISFRQKPRKPKPLLIKNWLVKGEQDNWIMVKQYHTFKRIHNYPDTYGSIDRISKDEEVRDRGEVSLGGNPIRGILFSYFFPKNTFKFGISSKDRGNIDYLRRSEVAWSRIVQKNPERDPYHRNTTLPLAFTKNYMKVDKHSSLMSTHSSLMSDHSSIYSYISPSTDSSSEFTQSMKMEISVVPSNLSENIKVDSPVDVYVEEMKPKVDEDAVFNERSCERFTTDELQNILVDLLIENFVDYGIDSSEKTTKQKGTNEVDGKSSKISENEESSSQKLESNSKTEVMKSVRTSLTDSIRSDLSFTESELHLICSQTLKTKRKLDEISRKYLENIVLSIRDLRELVNLLSGNKTGTCSSEVDDVQFSLDNVECLNKVFTSVELVVGGRHVVRVSNLKRNQVVKFVKFILREIYLHILSLSSVSENDEEDKKRPLEVERLLCEVEYHGSGLMYLSEIIDKISNHELFSKDDSDKYKSDYSIFVSPEDMEIIREKFVEQSVPLVKLLGRKDLSNKFPPVFTNSEISLLNMIYLNGNIISKVDDQKFETNVTHQDSLMDLIQSVQKSLSNKFSDSSIVDIRLALSRFEHEWEQSRNCDSQNAVRCEIANWAETLCSSRHYSQADRDCLKEVLKKITSNLDHLDKLEEYLESKKYSENITSPDEYVELEKEVDIFGDDQKTKKAIEVLKNILINRVLSARDLLLPSGVEPVVSETSTTLNDSESVVESINYSDSKSGELEKSVVDTGTSSFDKILLEKISRTSSEIDGSEYISSRISPSKFPYLKTRKFPFMRKISHKARVLKYLSRDCDFGASKRLKIVKLQKSKMASIVEKCVEKVDFNLIHYRRCQFKRKLTLISDRKMMYNTYFSYGFGSKPDKSLPIMGKKLEYDSKDDDCKENTVFSGCETYFDTNSSLSSLSNDLRHPLFSEESIHSSEIADKKYNEDECNVKLMQIREEIKNAKKYTPLKEKQVIPRFKEIDTVELSLPNMTRIHNRRVRHLKNVVTGNWTDSMTSFPSVENFRGIKFECDSSLDDNFKKSDVKLPEIPEQRTIIIDDSHSVKSSSSRHTSNEKLKLPAIKPKEKSISSKKSSEGKRSSSVKPVPLCVKLSKEFSDQNFEIRNVTKRNNDNYRMVANLKCDYRVRRDLMNLLDEPRKLPYLKPPPKYIPVPGFGDHPLLKFKLAESHIAQVHSFRMEKALKKAQFYKFSSEGAEKETNEEVEFMDPTKCITQPPLFPVNVVPRIMQKQVQSQCERYKETVEDCIREAKSIYDTLMFNKAVYDILKVNDKPDFVHQNKLDIGGKTKNHALFLEKRKRIRDLLLIGHTLLKRTYDSLLENIPNTFVDFNRYRNEKEYWDLKELTHTMLDDLKKGCEHFCTVWYVRLDDNFRKPEVLKEMPCDKIKRFMRLVSLILSYEISTAVERTLTNFTDVFCDKLKIPRLMFKTTLEATEFGKVDLHFCISPELQDIYNAVFQCLDCIFNIGQDLPMLFMPDCKPIKRYHKTKIKFIDTNKVDPAELPVNLPVQQNHRLYEECRKALYDSLEDNFKTLRSYMQTLEHSFAFLTYSQYAISTSSFLNNVKTTKEDVLDLLNIFRDYGHKIIRMLPFATFSMGLVEQEETFERLKVFVNDYIVSCILTVGRILKQDYYSLQEEFERVKTRALKPPITSEELVALGEFMSFVQTRWMRDRSTQIVTLSRYYWKVLEYFAMPHHDYCRSLTDWFLWYLAMFPMFQQFASLYEQIKFEFDEKIRDTVSLIEDKRLELVAKIPLLNNLNDVTKIYSYKQFIKRYLRDVEFIKAKMDWVNNEEKIFNRTLTKFGLVEDLNNILMPFCKLIFKVYSWYQKEKSWLNNSFDLLVTEEVETAFDRYYKDLLEMSKDMKILCRSLEKEELKYGVFTGYVDAEHEHQLPAPLILCHTTLHDLKEFQPILQLVSVICNKDLLERHWTEMSEIVGEDLTPNAGMTLLKYVDFDLFSVIDKLEIISSGASKELQLQDNLKKMYDEWKDLEFSVSKFKETDISILTGVDDIQALLDDQIVKTLAMRSSPFSKPVENEVKIWYDKLVRINKTIDVWGKVQVEWLHLYPIFTSEDIKQQMPKEAKFFQDVDTRFRNAIKLLMADRRAIVVGPAEGLLESLETCLQLMEEINNGVNLYLENKRLYFPRFFFLSNDEMLEILSQTTDPLRVQPHLKKCFEGIACLGFDEELDIYSMMSSEKEEIAFINKVSTKAARGSVEKWLVQVEKQMLRSVRHVIKDSFNSCKYHERKQWVRAWPGQVVLCVSQAFWTAEVHRVLRKQQTRAVYLYHKKLNKQLSDIIQLVRGKLTLQARITLGALVVLDVHSKDVTYGLYVKGIINERDFEWMAQLRYYWDREMTVSIINATVDYAYEYLGNTARLVITPLTDRCYRTLVGAYHLHLNGAPEGPAGTGKTETTKDLAKALAVQCIVFNCSDGLDYIAMGKFFKGLASCGAWACFDEFNRIEVEVLSVVAQQILCIMQAVRKHVKQFVFEGTTLTLNPACYVCITMNPGYAGRSELPDNLKVLFRTVAMMVPDYGLIGEISLYSYGFINARKLSEKIVTTYRLCSEQLSSQSHYDYGMRAVKTVLQAAGNLKLKFPKQSEEVLLLRSIMDVNLPKFLNHDVPLFEGIISDLFPGVMLPTPNYDKFIGAIKKSCEQHKLQPSPPFITKIIQTYEMMVVRHGFMLVGDPFSGKTSTLHVLADAITLLTDRKRVVKYQTLNPKSVTMGQLYGRFDDVSHEWSDGVLANAFREFAMSTSDERKWVIFDGPVDAVWIENMNTVLDDNKKLCLNSGEVMSMTWSMSMIFEVMDLAQASPATVSRCGMIYMESSTLGWAVLVDSWLACLPDYLAPHADTLGVIARWMIPPCLAFSRKHCHSQINAGVSNTVRSFCNFITVFLNSAIMEHDVNQFNANALPWIQAAVILSAVWAFSGSFDADSRLRFDVFFKALVQGQDTEHEPPEPMSKLISSVPPDGIWEDNFFVFKGRGFWSSWAEMAQSAKITAGDNLSQIVVPTLETVKYQYVIEKLIHNFLPVCLMGPTGTGKSFYIDDLITTRLSLQKFEPSSMTFTVNTQPNLVQTVVLSKLIKRKRSVFGPPIGKQCLIFIDDMNMPAKEVYGAQPPLELLRMYFDHGYWFDLKDMNKIFVEDLFFVAAMGPAGGSRQEVYARFLRHFCLLSINLFPEASMTKIYSTLLVEAMRRKGFGVDFLNMFRSTVTATINVYQKSILSLLPTPAKSHYTFNLRDISRVINGVMMFKKESYHDKPDFISLWLHEMLRVFSDRLVESNDRKWFFTQLKDSVKSNFRTTMEETLKEMKRAGDEVTEEDMTNLMFTSIFDLDNPDDKLYEQVVDMDPFTKIIQDNLDTYNHMHKTKIDIVLFRYALVHLSRILRLLSMPGGNGLLVGVAGSGRQSLTKLAASVYRLAVFQPEIKELYEFNEWRDDLKLVMKECGGRGHPMVFLFTENQIKHEYFLQDIDVLLNTGEVPNIFSLEETQEVLELARLGAQGGNRNLDVHPLSVLSYFRSQCRRNIHLMICFSPIGNSFRNRIRLYPAFVNCCTIDWFEDWPEDALEKVAERYFDSNKFNENIKSSLVNACKYFHVTTRHQAEEFFLNTGRKTYITSGSYLNLIRLYTNLFDVKQKEVLEAKMRYIIGLDSLQFAADQIAVMKEELEQLQPQLRGAAEAAEAMMAEIGAETVQVEAASRLVESEEVAAEANAHHANLLKQECHVELAATLPILNEAVAALNTLKPNDITVVKAMKNPPKAVKLVMAAVCLMMGIKAARVPDPNNPGRMKMDFWIPSVRLLGNTNFLKNLKEYDKDNISPAIMSVIRKEYIPNKEFNPSVVKKASKAAEGLCKWVIAMEQYDEVIKIVAPKKERMEMAEEVYERTLQELNDKKALLRGFEEKLAALQERLKQTVALKAQLTEEANMCWQKLQRAQQLIGGLGGEKERWTQAANSLQRAYENLAGDVLLSSAFIAYLGPFTTAYRHPLINDWKLKTGELSIPYSSDFDFIRSVGKDHVIQQWHLDGLPKDKFSVENGVMMASTNRYTFLIDPEGQANRWLKTMYMDSNMEVLKISDKQLMKKVETGILYGQPVLLEDVGEELDACLDPILLRTTFKQGGRDYITIGTKVIELHKDFNLFITTRLRCPHFLPEVLNKVTVINFALTKEALDDQLLAIAITILSPELEARRASMIVQSALNATALRNAEEDILKALSAPDKNVLEDENTIIILNESQKIAADIKEREKGTIETSDRISEFNKSFAQPVIYARSLYYCLTDLPNIDPMYHFSLPWFLRIYSGSLKADYDHFVEISNQPDAVRKNARFMPNMTFSLYSNVCRSLFEKDKLLFSFILCTNLMLTESKIRMEDLSFLLTGGVVLVNLIPNPAPNWILIRSWDELCRLSLLDGFQGLKEHVEKNLGEWRKYYDKAEPHLVPLPEPWNSKLTPFQKLLVLRIFHLDKMVPAIRNFVEQEMDECFVTPPLFDIAESYKDSNKVTPMIFILSPGVDPMSALQQFAEKMGYKEHEFESVSLGQGQGPIAENLIKKARLGGTWVCLQNCHLATSWMPTLEAICDDLVHSTKDGFRLWLTSYPSEKFPVPILQNGVKMTNEPPTGLKQNMLRTFMNEPITDQEFYNSCSADGGKQFVFARLLFGLTFFHAVVLERKKYGPIGWNIPYGFNESDYNISVLQLQEYMMDSEEVPFEAVTYLTGECNYGGRVTDNWDRRALNTILASFVNARIAANEDYCMLDNFSELTINADRHEFEYYIGIIENISDVQPAEVVGLNSNASISRDFHSTKQLFEAMQLVQPKTRGGGSSKKEDEMVITITTDIQQKLPPTFDVDLAVSRYPVSYSQSMNTVLAQEMERFNRLTGVVRASISMLQRAVRGAAVMTPDLEATFAAVLANRLPAAWAKVSYPSLKPLAEYVADLIGRLRFLQDWYDKGIPPSFWLSGFFFTQAFLTAAMQNYARRHVIPIDLLTFDFVITSLSSSDDVTHPPDDGVYVYGLFLEGARWDRQLGQLEEQQPKILFDIMPVIHFVPKQKKQTRDEGSEGRYVCPLYKTSERRGILSTTGHSTNYVLPLLLACSRTPAHWVKRGTALLCQLDN